MEMFIKVDCPPELGRGKILMYCGTFGWQENDFIVRCAGVGPILDDLQSLTIVDHLFHGNLFLYFEIKLIFHCKTCFEIKLIFHTKTCCRTSRGEKLLSIAKR